MDRFCCGFFLAIQTETHLPLFPFSSLVLCVIKHLPFLCEPGMIWLCIISVLLLLNFFVVTQKFHGKFQLFLKGSTQSWSWYSTDLNILNLPFVFLSVVFVFSWWFPMVSVQVFVDPSAGQRHSSCAVHSNGMVTACFSMHKRTKGKFSWAIFCLFPFCLRQCKGTRRNFLDSRFFCFVFAERLNLLCL